MTIWVWLWRDKKTPQRDLEEKLMMEAWYLLKDEGEGSLLPLPTFPLIIKNVAH